jgi:hypothetical protein
MGGDAYYVTFTDDNDSLIQNDKGTDLESNSKDELPLPFVLVPNASASGEVHPEDLSSDNEDEEQWVQDKSKTTKDEDKQQNGSQENASERLQDNDGTTEMTALKQNEDPPPQALAQLESSRNVRNVK